MWDVPSEVVREILLLLPAESLLRFKSVCKEWVRIIDDPFFVKTHTKNQFWSHTLLFGCHPESPLYLLCLDSFNFTNASQIIDLTRIKNLFPNYGSLYRDSGYVASCNGLILTSNRNYDSDISVILNPLTKESHYLPKPPNPNLAFYRYRYVVGYGFGYDSDSDDYKFVRIYEPYQTLVYSLKSDSWRTVEEDSNSNSSGGINRNGTFLNGSLYWPRYDAIIAFHLGTERYSQLPLPPVISSFRFALDAMDGCLICTLKDKDKETFDGWVMKEKSSWIKLFSLKDSIFRATLELRFVAYLKRKEQVVLCHRDGFLWFYIGNINSIKKCSVYGLAITSCQICPGSLVRLSDYRGQVATKCTLPILEKMKMICDDLSS